MRTTFILCLFLAGCPSSKLPSSATRSAKTAALADLAVPNGSCFNPGAPPYNGVPGDGLSDRVALQAAADDASAWSVAHGNTRVNVCLGAGIWNCERAPVTAYNRFSCVAVHAGFVVFTGVGDATNVTITGDQHQADILMVSFDPGLLGGGAEDIQVSSVGTLNTSEQTHLFGTSGTCDQRVAGSCVPIRNLAFRRVTCDHPRSTDGSRKGDCGRFLGNTPPTAEIPATDTTPAVPATPGTGIYGLVIEDSKFKHCARSGIQNQRGNHDVVIRRNEFWCDQPIHGEATGGSQEDENTNIEVTENLFHGAELDGTAFSSDVDVALSGTGFPYKGIHIHHNIGSRGIYLYRTAGAEVDHETLVLAPRSGYGIIEVSNKCDGLKLHDLNITRNGFAGPLIRLTPHSDNVCSNVDVRDNTLIQNTLFYPFYTEAASNVMLENNTIAWGVSAPKFSSVYVRSTTAPVTGFVVRSNHMTGATSYGVTFSAAPQSFGDGNEVSGNTVADVTAAGLVCGGPGGFSPVTYFGNTFNMPAACPGVLLTAPSALK